MDKTLTRPNLARLCNAMQRARLVLRRTREERVSAVKQYVGKHWSEEGSAVPVPCNLIALYVEIVGRKLVGNNPQVMLSAEDRKLKPIVNAMETWCNKEIIHIRLQETLERLVIDALFNIGICKVALATPADAATVGWNLKAGTPFAECIDLDDFVFDIHARRFDQCSFIGHRYRAPRATILDSKVYKTKGADIPISDDALFNLEGDERISVIGRGFYGDEEEFEDMVDLWEVYLPRHKLIVTLLDDSLTGAGVTNSKDPLDGASGIFAKAIRVQKWLGPDCGPYHILGLGVVPGNIMPKAPIQDLIDLHEAINRNIRKLIRQTDRQKQVTACQTNTEDAERLTNANDGDMVRVDHPDKINTITSGGPDRNNFEIFGAFKDLFSWLSGNLDVMGGLSPQSKTLGQDKLLNENSSASIDAMQQKTLRVTASVIEALCWYWHHDPFTVQSSSYSPPGLPEFSAIRKVHPAGKGVGPKGRKRMSRDHSFEDMQLQVDPYSLQHSTPQQRLAGLNQVVTQIITPMMQLLQAAGIQFDVNEYLSQVADLMNNPAIKDIVTLGEAPQQGGEEGQGPPTGAPGAPTKAPETTRNYVRHSQGSATAAGKDLGRVNQMQPSQNGRAQPAGLA